MKLSLVIPVYNESDGIHILKERLEPILHNNAYNYEIIFINDGSQDNTSELIEGWIKDNSNVSLIELSRNFGHQAAITAGLKEAKGDAVVIMDADLQDPPEILPQLIEKWREGYKVVLAERRSRGEFFLKRMLFDFFYKIFDTLCDFPFKITSGVFGLMDKTVVRHLTTFSEQNRFLPGLRSWVGFKSTNVWYDRNPRAFGTAKQSLRRLIKYGFDAVFSFSYKPLRINLYFGLIISAISFLYGFALITLRLLNINVVSGFTTVSVAIFFIGGLILISIGIIGEYLARVYDEVKQRPLFIIARKTSRSPHDRHLTTEDY